MNLLPRSHTEFASADYWEKFFKKRGTKAFEWYGEYPELCGVLHKYVKPADKILVVGCGNSALSADLYDVGHKNIINIDISDVVIKQMTEKNAEQRPDMKFLKMDMMQLNFGDGEFSVVLDKGTLDAIMTDDSKEVEEKVDKMFSEIGRVLRVGGRYVCVSLAQEHILKKILHYFPSEGWMVRICRILEEKDDNREFHLPVFVFVFTKFKKMPNMKPILEVCQFEDKTDRYDNRDDVTTVVREMQDYGMIRQQLGKRSCIGEDVSLDLYSAASNIPRYTLHIVDKPPHRDTKSNGKFAIFIVPEGREPEWLFSTDEGRAQLSQSAGFDRLVVVTLYREHEYGGLDKVKSELSGKVMELAPAGVGSKQVPFLSIGEDINKRSIRHRGCSQLSGDFVIEDVDSDGQVYRRLIFLSNKNVVQSETRLVRELVKKKGGKKKRQLNLDPGYLSTAYAGVMVAGLAMLQNFDKTMYSRVNLLLVGVGGGGLPMFIHKNFRQVFLTTVEIDPAIVTVAKDWFGLVEDERLSVHVGDGLDFVKQETAKENRFHVVMLDVDSKDTSVGMSCPPQAFVEPEWLQSVHSLLEPTGLLILNLVCRSQELKDSVMANLKTVFKIVCSCQIPENVNEIVYAFPQSEYNDIEVGSGEDLPPVLKTNLEKLQGLVSSQSRVSDVPSLTDNLFNLKLN